MKKIVPLGLAILSSFTFSFSQEQPSSKPQEKAATIEFISPQSAQDMDASDIVERQIEDFANRLGISYGVPDNKGRIFFYSVRTLNVHSPNFIKARIAAFDKAYLEAQRDLALYLGKDIFTKTLAKTLEDYSEGKGLENKQSNWQVLKKKLLALTDAALNKALEKLGVNPEKLGSMSLAEKRTLFLDTIKRQTIIKTFHELSGSVPVKTFEGINKDSNYAVGVILMYSPKLKQVAYDIVHKRESVYWNPKKGKPINAYLPKTDKGWYSSWNVRVVWDKQGYPAILSFGQWGENWSKNPKKRERYKKHIYHMADTLADAYIADFLAASVAATKMSEAGAGTKTVQILDPEQPVEKDIESTYDKYKEEIKRTAKVLNIRGIGTVARRTIYPKIGDRRFIIGVVVKAYTYESAQKAKGLENWKPKLHREGQSKPNTIYQPQTIESPNTTDVYDW